MLKEVESRQRTILSHEFMAIWAASINALWRQHIHNKFRNWDSPPILGEHQNTETANQKDLSHIPIASIVSCVGILYTHLLLEKTIISGWLKHLGAIWLCVKILWPGRYTTIAGYGGFTDVCSPIPMASHPKRPPKRHLSRPPQRPVPGVWSRSRWRDLQPGSEYGTIFIDNGAPLLVNGCKCSIVVNGDWRWLTMVDNGW